MTTPGGGGRKLVCYDYESTPSQNGGASENGANAATVVIGRKLPDFTSDNSSSVMDTNNVRSLAECLFLNEIVFAIFDYL